MSRYRWVILGIVLVIMANYAATFNTIPPILPFLIDDLGLSYSDVGLLQGVFSLPGVFLGILVGSLASVWGVKRIGIIGLTCLFVGNVIAVVSSSFLQLLFARILEGLGAFTVNIINIVAIGRWFKTKELGLAYGLSIASYPAAIIITLLSYSTLAANLGWQFPVVLSMIVALISLLVFVGLYKDPAAHDSAVGGQQTVNLESIFLYIKKTFHISGPLVLGLFFFMASESTFSTYAFDHFYMEGFSIQKASLIASTWMMGSLLLGALAGYIVDRLHHEDSFIVIGESLGAIIACVLFLSPVFIYPWMVPLLGITIPPCVTIIYRKNAVLIDQELDCYSSALMSTMIDAGFLLGAYLTGLLIDVFNTSKIMFMTITFFLVGAAVFQSTYLRYQRTGSK